MADSAEADKRSAGCQVASEMHLPLACLHSADAVSTESPRKSPGVNAGGAWRFKQTQRSNGSSQVNQSGTRAVRALGVRISEIAGSK